MTLPIALVLFLLVTVIVIFATEKISVDVATLALLAALVLLGILDVKQAFAGFSNEIIIILGSIFVLSGALMRTGVLDYVGGAIHRLAGGSRSKILPLVMPATAGVSAFMNNTTTTAMLMPAVLGALQAEPREPRQGADPARLRLHAGRHLHTDRHLDQRGRERLPQEHRPRPRSRCSSSCRWAPRHASSGHPLHGLRRPPPAARPPRGQPNRGVRDARVPLRGGGRPRLAARRPGPGATASLLRHGAQRARRPPRRDRRLYAEAATRCSRRATCCSSKARREALLKVKETPGIEIKPDLKLGDEDLIGDTLTIAEAILMPQSALLGRTVKELDFRRRFGMTVIAIYRRGHALATKIGGLPLRIGDVLLLQGRQERFRDLAENADLWVLQETRAPPGPAAQGALRAGHLRHRGGGRRVRPDAAADRLPARRPGGGRPAPDHHGGGLRLHRLAAADPDRRHDRLRPAMQTTGAAEYLATLIVDWCRAVRA